MIMGMNVFVRVRVLKRAAIIRIKICNKKSVILKTKMDFIPSVEKVEKLKKKYRVFKNCRSRKSKKSKYIEFWSRKSKHLNWVERFFVGSRKSKHQILVAKVETCKSLVDTVETYQFLVVKVET